MALWRDKVFATVNWARQSIIASGMHGMIDVQVIGFSDAGLETVGPGHQWWDSPIDIFDSG